MTALVQESVPTLPVPVGAFADDSWRTAAAGASTWLAGRPGLEAATGRIFDTNRAIRAATAARAADSLRSGHAHLPRSAEVTLEVFVQTLALVIDLREAARRDGVSMLGWIARRGRRAGSHDVPDDPVGPDDPDAMQDALARRLRICAESLGPTFVKFGQLVGSGTGLLPDPLVAEFGRCRDALRPEPRDTIMATVQRDVGRLGDVFRHFDPDPLAAASIAQVHAATLIDGTDVAVKVQRPGIRRRIERDICVLRRLAAAAERVDLLGTANLAGFVDLFAATVLEELDFRLEAENMLEIGLALEDAGFEDVVVPRPILVTPQVLVMERLHGRPMHDTGDTAADREERLALLRIGMEAVLHSALFYGRFHGDLHAGNILALDDGRFGLLDFGIVGRFDPTQRWALLRWLAALTADDVMMQLGALADLGAFPPGTDLDDLGKDVEVLLCKMEDSSSDEVTRSVELLVRLMAQKGLRLPKELSIFFKNLVHVSGSVRALVPGRSAFDELSRMFGFAHDRYLDIVRTP